MTANAQSLPAAADLGKAYNISGQRFGMLVAIERVIGTSNRESCCNVCLRELNGGRNIIRSEHSQSIFKMVYDATGSLYGSDYDEKFVSECLEEMGVNLQDEPQTAELATVSGEPPHDAGHGAMLFPISCVNGWPCLHCGKPFTEGFGCIECIEPVCVECTGEHSGQRSPETMTLQAVSVYFGVTRERIRQCEAKALRKLRHPSRAKLFKEYLDQDYLKVSTPLQHVDETKHCGVTLARAGRVIYCPRCGTTKHAYPVNAQ